jgi:hypothetical protein
VESRGETVMQVVCNIIFKREEYPDLQLECDGGGGCEHMRLHEPEHDKNWVCTNDGNCQEEYCIELTKEQKGEYFRCLLEGRI